MLHETGEKYFWKFSFWKCFWYSISRSLRKSVQLQKLVQPKLTGVLVKDGFFSKNSISQLESGIVVRCNFKFWLGWTKSKHKISSTSTPYNKLFLVMATELIFQRKPQKACLGSRSGITFSHQVRLRIKIPSMRQFFSHFSDKMSDFEIKNLSKHQRLSRSLHAEKSCSTPLKISIFLFSRRTRFWTENIWKKIRFWKI